MNLKRLTGNVSRTVEFNIGHHNCDCCGAETPPPPQRTLDDLAEQNLRASIVWPFEHYEVPGWTQIEKYGRICDRCTRLVMTVLTARKNRNTIVAKDPSADSDHALLEEATRQALQLADEGLLTAFPPPATIREFPTGASREYPYQAPGRRAVYRNLGDYKAGELRHRIRQISNVLRGKPADDVDEDTIEPGKALLLDLAEPIA